MEEEGRLHGPPQGIAVPSSRLCLEYTGQGALSACLWGAQSAWAPVLVHLRTIQQTAMQKGQSQQLAADRTPPV